MSRLGDRLRESVEQDILSPDEAELIAQVFGMSAAVLLDMKDTDRIKQVRENTRDIDLNFFSKFIK